MHKDRLVSLGLAIFTTAERFKSLPPIQQGHSSHELYYYHLPKVMLINNLFFLITNHYLVLDTWHAANQNHFILIIDNSNYITTHRLKAHHSFHKQDHTITCAMIWTDVSPSGERWEKKLIINGCVNSLVTMASEWLQPCCIHYSASVPVHGWLPPSQPCHQRWRCDLITR